jgi:hypothetical protein
MWILVVALIATGEVQITERGFESEGHCESRAQVWRGNLNLTVYRVDCAPTKNEIVPKSRSRVDRFDAV